MDFLKTRVIDAFWSYFAPSKHMDTDPYKLLFCPTLSLEVDLFLYTLWLGALIHRLPLTRFMLTEMHFKKKKIPPGHEFLFIRATDRMPNLAGSSELSLLREVAFIVERTVELDAARLQNTPAHADNIIKVFLSHPDTKKILAAVEDAFVSIPAMVLVAAAAAGATLPTVASLVVPLSLASTTLPSSAQASCSVPSTDPITDPSRSIADVTSLTVTQFFHFLSELSVSHSASESLKKVKPCQNAPADDRWVSGSKADTPEYEDDKEARWVFCPLNLTVFHLALLAHIIHQQYPIYSLFKRNCFWFTALIFATAKILDKMLHQGPHEYPGDLEDLEVPEVPRGMIDMIFLLLFLYAPGTTGRWMGFKVCEVKSILASHIVDLFLIELQEHEFKVNFSFIFQQFTNFLTAWKDAVV